MSTKLIAKNEQLRCAITHTFRDNGIGFWCVEYSTKGGTIRWDYPIIYGNGMLVWERPEYLPKIVRLWAWKQLNYVMKNCTL